MPRLFSTLIASVVGYLDGAGLSAVSLDLFSRQGVARELEISFVAALVIGPLGAFLGFALTLIGAGGSKEADIAE